MIMVGLGVLRYVTLMYDTQGYVLGVIGFSLVNSYIYYLERKIGISNKIIWIQSIIGVSAVAIITCIFYL